MTTVVLSSGVEGVTILEIAQQVAALISVEQPSALFSSTDRTELELRSVAVEAMERILRAHDWERLKVLAEFSGDGTTDAFALPEDFLRMPKDAEIWSTRWERPLVAVSSEHWLRLDIRQYDNVVGTWTTFGGNINFRPALSSDESAKFWYISNKIVLAENGASKATFTADTDRFLLDDRLLKMCMIWVWREQKQLEYSEELRNYEIALGREISDDKNARIITQSKRNNVRTKVAYPWAIVPS